MGLFKKKPTLATADVLPILKGQNVKKISVYSVQHQAYHEITLDEYCMQLKSLGLSDEEIALKLKKVSGE